MYPELLSWASQIRALSEHTKESAEQVAASAQSSIEISQDCEKDMQTTKEILHKILEISRSGRKD